jgi:AGCS family alanine or glycine:cation symporter
MQEIGAAFLEFIDLLIAGLTSFVFSQITIMGVQIEWAVLWLAIPMLFFTFYLKFVNVRRLGLSLRILKGRYTDDDAPGQVSQFQALTTALSGTIGLGNIAGVAIAIAIGGPGATFWMIVIAFFAMSLKFAEAMLAVKHRLILDDGTVFGGPMYYLQSGLEQQNKPGLGKFLAYSYAVFAVTQILQYTQVNQAYSQLSAVTGFEFPWLFGLGLAVAVGFVIIGGVQSVAKFTSLLVPLMCGIYLIATLTILITHVDAIPAAFVSIFEGAFAPEGVVGGVIGVFCYRHAPGRIFN